MCCFRWCGRQLCLHNMPISGVNSTPRPTAVYASDPALPRRPQDSLPSCLLGFGRTRLSLASSFQLSYRTPHPALGQDFTLSHATPSAASEHLLELIGFPISRSFTTYCVCLELRSLPSTGVTRLPRYYEPLRHPRAPSLSLTGFRLVIADHALGLPVFRALSLCTCRRHYPCAAPERITSLISSRRISLPRKGRRVDLRIVLFEACSAFTRVTACTLALSPIRDTLIEGFSHFVTSMTAPIASGWSGCRVGLAPTGKRRLCTAHTRSRLYRNRNKLRRSTLLPTICRREYRICEDRIGTNRTTAVGGANR